MDSNSDGKAFDIRVAGPERLADLSRVFGRAFVTEPTFAWALSGPNLEARLIRAFELYLARMIPLGIVWEAGEGLGAMVMVSDDRMDDWEAAVVDDSLIGDLADDGGARQCRGAAGKRPGSGSTPPPGRRSLTLAVQPWPTRVGLANSG
jgi:hypothetical protein